MADFCTIAELRSALGIGTLYSDATVEEVVTSATNIIQNVLWYNNYNILAVESTTTTKATVYVDKPIEFQVGQSIIISNCGTQYNGTKTVTEIAPDSFSYAITSGTVELKKSIKPYGTAKATTSVDYTVVPEIRTATLVIAIDIWQARASSNSGGVSPDFQPSPYKLGNTLLARVRSMIANYLNPNGLVG
jgi:hypothetical protein